MKMFKEVILKGKNHDRKFAMDIRWLSDNKVKPVILFLHGFKGFKDWGTFPLLADKLSDAGFIVVKMNFSHNGVTIDDPINFADLAAFSENRFTYELEDVAEAVDFISGADFPIPGAQKSDQLFLIGHSRGGATAILYGAEDDRIDRICGWAAVCELESRWPEDVLEHWKKEGIIHVPNSRTGQDMPMKYSIVEDYFTNRDRLDVANRLREINKPVLLIHGTDDETVPLPGTKAIADPIPHVELAVISEANHVFGGGHPFDDHQLPEHSRILLDKTIAFFREDN